MKKFRIFLSVCCLAMVVLLVSAQRTFWYVDEAGVLRGIKTNRVNYIAFNPDSKWFAMTCDPKSEAAGEIKVKSQVTVNGDDVLSLADNGTDVVIGICYSRETDTPTVANDSIVAGNVFGGSYDLTLSDLYTGTYYVRTYMKYHGDFYYSEAYPVYVKGSDRDIDGHRMIDLALPSGILWADCNLGASTNMESGDMYSWGETKTKATYEWSTYKWCDGTQDNVTKYATGVDGLLTLESSDDAATATWGESFRMPTKADFQELMDNCTRTRTYRTTSSGNRVYGWQFRSKNNKGALFFPDYSGTASYYWASTKDKYDDDKSADLLQCNESLVQLFSLWRFRGFAVRAVHQP